MPRPINATIDLAALRHNLTVARRHARGRRVWAVVKANAYGHGIERAVRAFGDADGLALLDLAEAQRARDAGWRKPILLLEGFFEPADLDVVDRLDLTSVIHDAEQIAMLRACRPQRPLAIHLKINTGMNRLGFADLPAVQEALAQLQALPHARVTALMTHFANADRDDAVAVDAQLQRFKRLIQGWQGEMCLANSAALFMHSHVGGASVRPGIVLYGASPAPDKAAAAFGVRAAMTLSARVIATQQVAPGGGVGYGVQFAAATPLRVGVVACGYADGYPRSAPNGTPAFVENIRVPTVGRVSMDMLCVDLTHAPQAGIGAEVELWGSHIPIDEVATVAGTVGYELMCALAARVPVREIG
ncbi:MAG TPA: alanine racemase [Burkholderiaceae bacterium]|nr:alanine racemase [Burkholderiaceae bacterium]